MKGKWIISSDTSGLPMPLVIYAEFSVTNPLLCEMTFAEIPLLERLYIWHILTN